MVSGISGQVEFVEESGSRAQGCAGPTEVSGHGAELKIETNALHVSSRNSSQWRIVEQKCRTKEGL